MAKVAFIGLGTMGYAMAGHLQQQHDVRVYNRTSRKAEQWCRDYGGSMAATPKEAATDSDVTFICVGNDEDVRSVTLGDDGVLAGLGPDTCLVDHTTASPALARELDTTCQLQAVAFLDAPVSGGAEGARDGKLTVMCGGDKDTFTNLEPMLSSYAANLTLIGPAGSGQAAKMINQICVAGVLQSLAEGLQLAKSLDLNIPEVMAAISKGAAGSWQMERRWESMMAGDFSPKFSVKWMAKDLGICLHEAAAVDTDIPVTRMIDSFYRQLASEGDAELDITSLMKRLD